MPTRSFTPSTPGIAQLTRALCAGLLAAASLITATAHAVGIEVKAASESTPTPKQFGLNFSPGISPETVAWMLYAGGTSHRFRTSASCVETYPSAPESISKWTFIQRRHEIVDDLRDHPEDFDQGDAQRHVDWGAVRSSYQDGSCGDLELALDAFDAAGQRPLILIDSKTGPINEALQGPPSDPNQPTGPYWFQRWFVWRHYFKQAYYLARVHGITHFEFVNEPESALSEAETIERMRLAGDAIQRAFDTVNRWRESLSPPQPALQPVIMAAAFIGHGFESYESSVVGQRVLQDFYGYGVSTAWAFPTSFNAYSYHHYVGNNPDGLTVSALRSALTAATGSSTFPIHLTETNLRSGCDSFEHGWNLMTQDSVRNAVGMARLLRDLDSLGIDGGYLFKFSDFPHALYWAANEQSECPTPNFTPSMDVGGAKRAGEVARLFAAGFADALPRKQYTITSADSSFLFDVAYDPVAGRYTIMSVNNHCDTLPPGADDNTIPVCDPGESDSQTVTVDLSALLIPVGTPVMVQEVSTGRRGEVRSFYTVDAERKVALLGQPAQSVAFITVPVGVANSLESVIATADGYVRDGSSAASTFGTGSSLYAYANATGAGNRRVSFIKIALPSGLAASSVATAVLKLTARSGTSENSGSGTAVAHVYGVDSDSWTESTLSWNSAPNLGASTANLGAITSIAGNLLRDVGVSAHPLGAITGTSNGPTTERIDVTDYVRSQANGVATFMIIREVRHAGDTAAANASLWIASREHSNSDYKPTLELVRRCGALGC